VGKILEWICPNKKEAENAEQANVKKEEQEERPEQMAYMEMTRREIAKWLGGYLRIRSCGGYTSNDLEECGAYVWGVLASRRSAS